MQYNFKVLQECFWAALTAGAIFAVEAAIARPDWSEPKFWLPIVAGGAARAALAAGLAVFVRGRVSTS